MDVNEYLLTWKSRINRYLEQYISSRETLSETLHQAVTYTLLKGGKRLRPILCVASCEAFGTDGERALPFAGALEMIHSFSLIHDDLPAMDNDDLRRQMPTNHKVYGEGQAILAGDALLAEAFRIMTDPEVNKDVPPDMVMEIIFYISNAVGLTGMAAGQSLDLLSEDKELAPEALTSINEQKTGQLFSASTVIGAKIAGANQKMLDRLATFGLLMGQAFQIVDDIFDLDGKKRIVDSPEEDEKKSKMTVSSLLGVEKSMTMAQNLISRAKQQIEPLEERSEILCGIADFVIERKS